MSESSVLSVMAGLAVVAVCSVGLVPVLVVGLPGLVPVLAAVAVGLPGLVPVLAVGLPGLAPALAAVVVGLPGLVPALVVGLPGLVLVLSRTKHVWYSEHGTYYRFEFILERVMSATHIAVILQIGRASCRERV